MVYLVHGKNFKWWEYFATWDRALPVPDKPILRCTHPDYSYEKPLGRLYATRAEGIASLSADKTETCSGVPTYEEWRIAARRVAGEVTRENTPPWHGEEVTHSRYPRLDLKAHPGEVGFYKTSEDWVNARLSWMRIGRYLPKFVPNMDKKMVDAYVDACKAEGVELKIARTPDEIELVYKGGPTSCMKTYAGDTNEHPVRVYGDSDLGIAYFGMIENVIARAIVWPDKKLYGRLYGAGAILQTILHENQYKSGSMNGAHIRCVRVGKRGFLMPYVDHIPLASLVVRDGVEWLKLDNDGTIDTQITQGVSTPVRTARCDHCTESYNPDDDYSANGLCGNCVRYVKTCDRCGCMFRSDDVALGCKDGTTREWRCAKCCEPAYTCLRCGQAHLSESLSSLTKAAAKLSKAYRKICQVCLPNFGYCELCDSTFRKTLRTCRCQKYVGQDYVYVANSRTTIWNDNAVFFRLDVRRGVPDRKGGLLFGKTGGPVVYSMPVSEILSKVDDGTWADVSDLIVVEPNAAEHTITHKLFGIIITTPDTLRGTNLSDL